MAFRVIFLEEFGEAFVPKRAVPYLRLYLLKAGFHHVPYKFFGGLFYMTALITALVYIFWIFPFLREFNDAILLIGSFILWFAIQITLAVFCILIIYFYLDLKIYQRTKEMESMLPDFLQMVSSNLKGGMSLENSLIKAIRPRFKILANEMAVVSKKVMTGHDVGKALYELGHKYNSPMLRRFIDLMISELESGGQISDIIDRIVDSIKDTRILKEEISANALAYIIFISIIVIFISPLLFALSFNLLLVILGFAGKLAGTSSAGLPFSFGEVTVNPVHFRYFSIGAISLISFFASLIVSIVEKGDIKAGLKYIPIYLLGSLGMYWIFMNVLSLLFGGFAI